MTTRRKRYPGIDVGGHSLRAILAAMGPYRSIADKALTKHAIWKIEEEEIYPLDVILSVFDTIVETVGTNTMFAIGKRIPEYGTWPEGIQTIVQALESLDIAYRMNHRKDGKPMFDPAAETMFDGIGHLRLEVEGPRRLIMTCENPYPSDLDRGIITAVARKFESTAEVERDTTKPTRLEGADSCTFIVTF